MYTCQSNKPRTTKLKPQNRTEHFELKTAEIKSYCYQAQVCLQRFLSTRTNSIPLVGVTRSNCSARKAHGTQRKTTLYNNNCISKFPGNVQSAVPNFSNV